MVVLKDKPIAMPRPFGGDPPTITVGPRTDGKPGRYITVQITGAIQSVYQFLEFIQVLDNSDENDIIDVVLDTPGGCVFTTQVLLERMNSSKATVTSVASGLVASAGTFLWFFSKRREVRDWATFMFHSSSHGDFGKSLSIQETSTEMVNYMQKTVKAMIDAGILTQAEASKIFRQKKDLFLPGSIIRARMMAEMASTEGLRLRDEDGEYNDPDAGTDATNDRPTDPSGNPDEHAQDDIDNEKTSIDPEAIFRAEGVETETQDDNLPPDDQNQNPDAKKGGKRKAKRRCRGEGEVDENGNPIEQPAGTGEDDPAMAAKKRRAAAKKKRRARAEGDTGAEIPDGAETADTDNDSEVAGASPDAYLRW